MDYTLVTEALLRDTNARVVKWLPKHAWMKARSQVAQRTIEATRPFDDASLAVFAHECGHIAIGSAPTFFLAWLGPCPVVKDEHDASQWALTAIAKYGTVTDAMREVLNMALTTYLRDYPCDQFHNALLKGE